MTGFLTHLEEDIKRLYAQLQISGPAYREMQRIASEFRVWVHYEETGSMMIQHQGLYSIILNRSLSPEEQWQDFAHELCHVLKHTGNHFKMNKLFRELQGVSGKTIHVSLLCSNLYTDENEASTPSAASHFAYCSNVSRHLGFC